MREAEDTEGQDDEPDVLPACAVCGTALSPAGPSPDFCSELCQKAFARRGAISGSPHGAFVLPRRGAVVRWFAWLTSFLL